MYLILKNIYNRACAGTEFENCSFEFPTNLKVRSTVEFKHKKDNQIFAISNVLNYQFINNSLCIHTRNSMYTFEIVCD